MRGGQRAALFFPPFVQGLLITLRPSCSVVSLQPAPPQSQLSSMLLENGHGDMYLVPAIREAEAGGLPELRKPAWAAQCDLTLKNKRG